MSDLFLAVRQIVQDQESTCNPRYMRRVGPTQPVWWYTVMQSQRVQSYFKRCKRQVSIHSRLVVSLRLLQ